MSSVTKEQDTITPACAVCSKKTNKSCAACGKVYYCGVDHQKQHRKTHKLDCFPAAWVAAEKKSPAAKNNRYETQLQLVATRNIEKGDLIFREKAIVSVALGDSIKEDKCLICEKTIEAGKYFKCADYLWSICSEQCAQKSEHIAKCRLLSPSHSHEDDYTKVVSTSMFRYCTELESKDAKAYKLICTLLKELLDVKSEDELQKISKEESVFYLLKTFYRNPCIDKGVSYLFQNGSLLTHHCVPNGRILICKSNKANILVLKAIVPIIKGQVISINFEENNEYPLPLMGLQQRHKLLASRFNFYCLCYRCSDPTELKTFASGIKCNEKSCSTNAKGYYLFSNETPTNPDGKWCCANCKATRENSEIIKELENIHEKLAEAKIVNDVDHFINDNVDSKLHCNHYLLNQMKYRIIKDLINNKYLEDGNSEVIIKEETILQKLFTYANSLLRFADKVNPGFSQLREQLCLWLKIICSELCIIYSEEGNLPKYIIKLKECQKYREELLTIQNGFYTEDMSNELDHSAVKDTNARTFINLDEYFGTEPKCAVCFKPSPMDEENSCTSCKAVFYCSAKHKKAHLKQHLNEDQCYPVIVTEDSTQGRFLVATRDIQKDELILREKAIVSSPSSVGGAQCNRICLGCYRSVKTSYTCSKCKWPMCDKQCENSAQHADRECIIFSENSVPPVTKNYQYEFVKALRCLLIREVDKVRWNKILSLESHSLSRKKRPVRLQLSFEAISFIRTKCNLTQFQPDIIDHVVGVNAVNAFGLQLDGGGKGNGIRTGSYLFYKTCMMSHSCSPNSTSKYGVPTLDSGAKTMINTTDYNVCIYANKMIQRGESVTTTYVDLNKNTFERQRLLYDGYFFCCSCQRCANPAELDSLIGVT